MMNNCKIGDKVTGTVLRLAGNDSSPTTARFEGTVIEIYAYVDQKTLQKHAILLVENNNGERRNIYEHNCCYLRPPNSIIGVE